MYRSSSVQAVVRRTYSHLPYGATSVACAWEGTLQPQKKTHYGKSRCKSETGVTCCRLGLPFNKRDIIQETLFVTVLLEDALC